MRIGGRQRMVCGRVPQPCGRARQGLSGAHRQLAGTDPDFVDAIDRLNEIQQNGWFMGGLERYYTLTLAEAMLPWPRVRR